MNYFTITFYKALNYGAFLQCFALQKKIEKSNVLAIRQDFLSHIKKQHPFIWPIFLVLFYLKKNIKKIIIPLLNDWQKIKSIECSNFSECESVLKEKSIIVIGSDQVWNPDFTPNMEKFYFADFAGNKIHRISYAASLGKNRWPEEFEKKVIPLLKKFDAISVREETSVSYLKELGIKDVVCVCDPTILHKADFYRSNFCYKQIPSEFIFVYRIREKISNSIQSIFCNQVNEVYLQNRKSIVSVSKWLQYIDCSKFVVTDSFHCVVFCLLFHKPFLVILNQSKKIEMNERFSTLLGIVGLEYRCLVGNENPEKIEKLLNTVIDWQKVDLILDEWRKKSSNWLKQSLRMSSSNISNPSAHYGEAYKEVKTKNTSND